MAEVQQVKTVGIGDLMANDPVMVKQEMENRKKAAINGYLEAAEKHGEEHVITQLRKCVMEVVYQVAELKETVGAISEMFKVINEFNDSITELSKMGTYSIKGMEKIKKLPRWMQKIATYFIKKRFLREKQREYYAIMSGLKINLEQFEFFKDFMSDMVDMFKQIAAPKKKKKKKQQTESTPSREITNPLLAADLAKARAAKGMTGGGSATSETTETTGTKGATGTGDTGSSDSSDILF